MSMDAFTLHHGDCLDVLRGMESASVDSIVTDPPYGLSFMGKRWDYDVPSVEIWAECLRVLKPGGHLLAFAGTRTQHRMACRIEDAGFHIRDLIAWVYGSGFPKSHNLSGEWQGWGTALKPALEPITVARKPLAGTVAENVLAHGTGALNIDGCRVGMSDDDRAVIDGMGGFGSAGWVNTTSPAYNTNNPSNPLVRTQAKAHDAGRWPANLIHDGSDEPAALLGDAARFFYCAKASKRDRDEGVAGVAGVAGVGALRDGGRQSLPRKNHHPTVKPTELMRYLCRLVTPPGGVVLDPFTGSGSTGKAAMLEGFRFIGIEREAEYVEIARARIQAAILPLMAA
jgi:site-specific DNA-methyltransferase (adenine-specific)